MKVRAKLFCILLVFLSLSTLCYFFRNTKIINFKGAQIRNDLPLVFYYIWTTEPGGYVELHRRCLESALFHHPNSSFRIFSSTLPANFFSEYALLGYDIEVYPLDYDTFFEGTKVQPLLPKVKSSPFAYSHLSDLFRIYMLWKHGGVYLDTDVFLLKNLDPLCKTILQSGVIGIQEAGAGYNSYNGAILCFPEPNHAYLHSVINRAMYEYEPTDWVSLGPRVLSRSIETYPRALHVETLPENQTSIETHLNAIKDQFLINQSWFSPTRFDKILNLTSRFLVVLDRVEFFYPRHWSSSANDTRPLKDADVDKSLWFTITNQSYAHHISTNGLPMEVKNGKMKIPETSLLGRIFQLIPKFDFRESNLRNGSME